MMLVVVFKLLILVVCVFVWFVNCFFMILFNLVSVEGCIFFKLVICINKLRVLCWVNCVKILVDWFGLRYDNMMVWICGCLLIIMFVIWCGFIYFSEFRFFELVLSRIWFIKLLVLFVFNVVIRVLCRKFLLFILMLVYFWIFFKKVWCIVDILVWFKFLVCVMVLFIFCICLGLRWWMMFVVFFLFKLSSKMVVFFLLGILLILMVDLIIFLLFLLFLVILYLVFYYLSCEFWFVCY